MNKILNNWNRSWLPVLSLLIIFLFHNIIYAASDFKILDSSDRGLTIEFSPTIERLDTMQLKGESYLKIYLIRTSQVGEPGEPMVPVRVMTVGVPLESEVNISILSVESREISGKLLPAPTIDGTGKYNFEAQSASYQSSVLFPQQILIADSPAFMRDQRIIKIKLFAAQFAGQLERIKIYSKIIVRVDFVGRIGSSMESRRSIGDDEFYRGAVINYAQSKKWLKPHIRSLKRPSTSYQTNSWYKISIRQEGIYKITGAYLSSQRIDIGAIKPESIKIFNNGGRELPRSIKTARPDSLIENAIRVVDLNSNGKVESDDYFLFYGKAVNNWALPEGAEVYQHYINHYTHENSYWLTWDNITNGKRMQNKAGAPLPNINLASHFWGLHFNEDETNNFFNSGLDWFGRLMIGQNVQQGYAAYLPNPANQSDNIYFKIQGLGITSGNHRFAIHLNDQLLTDFTFYGGYQLKTQTAQKTITLAQNGINNLKITYNGSSAESQAYIDWFEIQYRKQFIAEDNYLIFNQISDGPQNYQITNFKNDPVEVYDITDWSNVQSISNPAISSGTIAFGDTTTAGFPLRKYIALTSQAYLQPVRLEAASFTDLRSPRAGADFIIIAHDDFYDAVMPLKSLRESYDSLKTEVVRISDIYNQFSWGLVDPIAIRDFIKYAFDNWVPSPKYVLLCGDGDYDYKNIKSNLDKNWLPPYETTELNESSSRTMDEFFVLVSGDDDKPDLAIGRFPVQSAGETEQVVEKIIEYETAPFWQPGQTYRLEDWRNLVTMVGDDEYHTSESQNEVMHTRDAEYIMEYAIPKSFNKEKIYLLEYPAIKEPSFSGFRKPAATDALLKRLNNGTLILNYVGHGAPSIWADERVLLESRDLDRIQNQHKLPLWIAATCDFGRFDDPMEQGMAEKLFVAKGRGGIAFVTSARLAYATDNTELNRKFYNQLFPDDEGPTERLGVALINAKINNYSGINDQKYHLFGDPTLRLAKPDYAAKITSIQPDTLKALNEIKIAGQILKQNARWEDFEGKALLKIFDSKTNKIYKTSFGSELPYVAQGKTVFRGTINVSRGQFEARFIVPKDITYGGASGRISLYFANEQFQGAGYQDLIPVGGTSVLQDTEGPSINIGFDGQSAETGSPVGQRSILEVEIADSISGVNIAGDIGHHITMVLDEQENEEIVLTDLFNYYEGNFKAGKVRYDFSNYKSSYYDQNNNLIERYGLAPGEHTVRIKAWDNFNNSSIAAASFTVITDDILRISDVFNYPNPFSAATTFIFSVNHPSQIKLKIFTVAGRLIQSLTSLPGDKGPNQIPWDGRDKDGDELANGVYLYQLTATAQYLDKTIKDEYIGKLVIAR